MWLATKHGFYSIVRKQPPSGEQPAEYHVRARVRKDLENLLAACGLQREILDWSTSDYRFRFLIGAEDLGRIMEHLGDSLDYSNFKSQVARNPDQRDKLGAYHQVWATMAGLQP